MAGIDPSIYGQVAPPPDPFAIPGKILALKQGMVGLGTSQIENQLLQRRLQGDQALQDAYSAPGAVNDQGETNIPIVRNALIGSPAAVGIPDEVRRAQGNVGGNITNTGAGQTLQGAQLGSVGQIFGAALQGGGSFGKKEALGSIMSAVQAGQITPAMGNTLMHQLPRTDDAAKAWANGMFLRTLPSTGAQPSQIGVDAQGRPVMGTGAQVVTKAVDAVPAPAPATKGAPAPAAPKMGYTSGLAPGDAESTGIDKAAAAQQGASFERAANSAVDIKSDIANAEDKLKKIATGPFADKIYKAKSGFNELLDATGAPIPGWDKEGVANLEEFRKLAQNIVVRQFGALGGTGTDSQLSAVTGANPGSALSSLTNKQMLSMLKGNQDAIEAKATAWRDYKKTKGTDANFNTFSEDFNRSFSPRAFQFVHMSPDERKDMVKGMTPVEKSQLNTALQTAMERGWINAPGASK
jgi:hypothetical protein